MNKQRFVHILIITILALHSLSFISRAYAQPDNEKKFLLMYFTEEELLVESPTRSVKPVSQTAENVTVITAKDIERMNAHSVGDVLNTVTGVQVALFGGLLNGAAAFIQGSEERHLALFIDGIPLNNLSDNIVDLGILPVQNIEKIEILKGPASSAWGSALGGIVNIITKSGNNNTVDGSVSASYGERNTGDFRAEIFGKEGPMRYYLNGGKIRTDGFDAHFDASASNAYLKLQYALTDKTSIQYTFGYINGLRGAGEFTGFGITLDEEFKNLRSAVTVKTTVGRNWDVRVSIWSDRLYFDRINSQLSDRLSWHDTGTGASAQVTWKHDIHNLSFGVDNDSKSLTSNRIQGGKQAVRKSAVYLNDTLSFENLSVTPGIRYDDTNKGYALSPSIGATYQLPGATVLRAYTSRGFNIPPLAYLYGEQGNVTANPSLQIERVRSYQAGAESTALKYLWIKLSAFRHDVQNAFFLENNSGLTQQVSSSARQRRDGFEVEIKTTPLYNTSLTAGTAYVDIRDVNTGLAVWNTPRSATDVGLVYDDERSFSAMIKGRYIDWHMDPAAGGNYGNFVFDLNVVKIVYRSETQSAEAFLTTHNLFDGSQYPVVFYKNPGRWVEGGLRCRF